MSMVCLNGSERAGIVNILQNNRKEVVCPAIFISPTQTLHWIFLYQFTFVFSKNKEEKILYVKFNESR